MLWLKFLVSASVIVVAGVRLTKYADILGDRLNIGKVWVGIVVLGLITSLPEAVSALTATLLLNAPDLAVGNLFGSNNFNPLLIVVMDLVYRQGSVTDQIPLNKSHLYSAGFSICLSLIVMAEIYFRTYYPMPNVGGLSVGTLLIFVVYISGMRKLAVMGDNVEAVVQDPNEEKHRVTMGSVYLNLAMCAVLVVVSAIWLANICNTIAEVTGLGGTFVGSIFLALVTSLPEMVVSISALKLGQFDLAIGNIFGSNMTNTFIVFLTDLFYRGKLLLGVVSQAHLVTIGLSVILSAILIVGLKTKNKKTLFCLGWDSIVLLTLFIVGTYFMYILRPESIIN